MKKTICYLIFIFFITISQSISEIVYIDINKILNESTAGKKALGELEKNIKERNEFFSSTEKKLIEEEKKIITQKNILSKEDYNKKLVELSNKVKSYNLNKNKKIKELNEKKIIYRNKFIEMINPIIAEYASENNIDIVIRKEQMIVGKTELDISEPILSIVNKKIKKIN
tara:strand:+ start:774 stop:1283 length:510 start_codon:yes stop_codon:yes gene_type:complete